MIRDIFNVCVALVLSARARQIFWRILWRHRTIIAMAAAAAVPAIVMLMPVGYHEGAPARHEALEWHSPSTEIASGTSGQVLTMGGDTATTLPVLRSSATSGASWTTSSNWTSAPLNVTNGGTGMVVAYRSCTIDGTPSVTTTTLPAMAGMTSGSFVTLSSTNMTCSVQR